MTTQQAATKKNRTANDNYAMYMLDLVYKLREVDNLCALVVETSANSKADKWLKRAHESLGQATEWIERAIKSL